MENSALPLGILLLGLAAVAGFIGFRPWPVTPSGAPVKPGAYVVEILEGHPPAASISKKDSGQQAKQITEIQNGLTAAVALWVVLKLANGLTGLVSLFTGGG